MNVYDTYSCCRLLLSPGAAAEIEELALAWSDVFGSCRFRRKSLLERLLAAGPDNNAIFTTRSHKKTIGFIHIQAAAEKPLWYNRGIGVLPSYRHHGVGSGMLQAAVNYVRCQGAVAIVSYTDKQNDAALALHLRLGFTADYPASGPRSELRHRLLLEL